MYEQFYDHKNLRGNFTRHREYKGNFILYLIAVAIILFSSSSSNAQETKVKSIQEKLASAEEQYYEGLFTEAVTIINECLLNEGIQKQEQITAYTLLANIRLAQENREAAEAGIRKLLEINPGYMPTIEEETPQYVALVTEVKTKIKQEQPKKKKWLWIGAGATTVVAVATYFIIQGSSNGSQEEGGDLPLALPPAWPEP
jgi:hypothetical protein